MSRDGLVLRAATLWSDGRLLEGAAVAVEDGKVTGVFGRDSEGDLASEVVSGSRAGKVGLEGMTEADGWAVVDLGPRSLLPGLIDCHVHTVFPGDGSVLHDALGVADSELLLRAAENGRRALRAGVTTVVDVGAPPQVIFPLVRAVEEGVLHSARIIPAGPPVTITGGHCWPMGGEADSKEDVVTLVRRTMRDGAALIKVMGTGGGTPGTNSFLPVYPQETLEAIVAEARRLGRRTLIHSGATLATRSAVRAGFDVIFHGHFHRGDGSLVYDRGVVAEMIEAGTHLNPTLWVNRVVREVAEREAREGVSGAQKRSEIQRAKYRGQTENVSRMLEAGVSMLMGSDSGWGHVDFSEGLIREMECFSELGSADGDLLRLATRGAAEFLEREDLGGIFPGAAADILGVCGKPWEGIPDLRKTDFVMTRGEIFTTPVRMLGV